MERLLLKMRDYLRIANQYKRAGLIELADAAGAIAAFWLERAIRAGER